MSLHFRFPDYSWLVQSTDFGQFLEMTFENDFGEVWLYNNDLEMISQRKTFEDLYLNGVCGHLSENIDAVKILVKPSLLEKNNLEGFLRDHPVIPHRLEQIASLRNGRTRLSTFYFGIANNDAFPEHLRNSISPDDSWIFYAQRAELDFGVVMLRQKYFPFQDPRHGDARFANIWLLQRYPELTLRLKEAFMNSFRGTRQFKRLEFTTSPFRFSLVPVADEARKRRANSHEVRPLALGDSVDFALVTALPEEMEAIRILLDSSETMRTPLADGYEYVTLKTQHGLKKVLLVCVGDQGTIPAALATFDAIQRWRPGYVMLVGVAGSDPEESTQKLGDIVVGKRVMGYEKCKVEDGVIKYEPSKFSADEALLKQAQKMKGTWQPKRLKLKRPDGSVEPCTIHDDLVIASGNTLVADPSLFKVLQGLERKVKAVEMEAEGVGHACEKSRNVKFIVIKGIMDNADKKTRDETPPAVRAKWMLYAAAVAAEFAIDVLKAF